MDWQPPESLGSARRGWDERCPPATKYRRRSIATYTNEGREMTLHELTKQIGEVEALDQATAQPGAMAYRASGPRVAGEL